MQWARTQSMLIFVRLFQFHDGSAGPALFLLRRVKLRDVWVLFEQIGDGFLEDSHAVAVNDAHALYLRQGGAVQHLVYLFASLFRALSNQVDLAIGAVEA